ncbi:SpaH/EbpB family LPXTG-anchored major pilin [Bifidobacterium aquikefiricola]|uniref:SpaH/EbpB family LPXTG-anchored major pilin n=1 Tax=Bifidobacterium aquikefiricola TaxID=3059038 RepID=A0AB39U7Y0_9BIFI
MSTQSGNKFWLRKIAAAAGALALGVAGLAGLAQTAQADENIPVTGVGNINPGTATSLTIHKFDGAQGNAGDGTVQDTSKMGNPLQGVEFTVTPVTYKGATKIDLDTEAGWDAINGIQATDVTGSNSAYTQDSANATKITTDASGTATESLPHGLYLVQETGSGNNNIVSSVAPFLVTLPLPQGSGNWLYDVNVYPKNQVLNAPQKTINSDSDQKGLKVGDTVQWTITQSVPRLNAGDSYNSASIWDVMPTDGSLAYDATASLTLNGAALSEGTDYTIDPAGTTWTLTSTGLGKIKAGDTLAVTFTTKVLKVTKDGSIANPGSSTGTPGYGSEFNGHKVPGNPTPYTYWGQLAVTKVDENKNVLKGATFQVTAKTAASCPATVPSDGVVSTGTSDGNGIVQWDATSPASSPLGLFVANSNNGPLQSPSKDYCLYETAAPAGYIAAAVQTVTITAGTDNLNTVTVTDVQQGHPTLPLTGAQGIVLMSVVGIVLIAAGGTLYVVSRRRASQNQ